MHIHIERGLQWAIEENWFFNLGYRRRRGSFGIMTSFLQLGVYPNGIDKRELRSIKMMAMQYILYGGQLYRRSYNGVHLRFLKKEEAEKVMEEVHQGILGPHINGRMLAKKILRIGYY